MIDVYNIHNGKNFNWDTQIELFFRTFSHVILQIESHFCFPFHYRPSKKSTKKSSIIKSLRYFLTNLSCVTSSSGCGVLQNPFMWFAIAYESEIRTLWYSIRAHPNIWWWKIQIYTFICIANRSFKWVCVFHHKKTWFWPCSIHPHRNLIFLLN